MEASQNVLSSDIKSRLMGNLRELSTIEGNILSAAGAGKAVKSILVTSSAAREGKTTTALSIAYGLAAESNARVLLVDGNMRYPTLHKMYNTEVSPGLTDMFSANPPEGRIITETDHENLFFLPNGTKIYNSLDVYKSPKFKTLLAQLSQEFDYIIFDCYSVHGSSDVSFCARYFDGIVLAVECEITKWGALNESINKIRTVDGNILGTVMVKRKYYVPKALLREHF